MDSMDREYEQPVAPREERPVKRAGFGAGFLAGILVLALVLGVGAKVYTTLADEYIVIGPKKAAVAADSSSVLSPSAVEKLEELFAYMDIYYYEDYDTSDVQDSILAGALEGLGDPYSVYYTADEYASLKVDTSGDYYGIGAGLVQDADTMEVTVSTVYEGTPAEEAGLLTGDQIVMVDDIEAVSMELSELVQKIRGREGTTVHLQIYRAATGESLEFDVERRNVQLLSVSSELVEDQIGYIQISEFQSNTPKQFEEQLAGLQEQGMKGLIVDLRGNPGGLLTSVVEILDDLVPEGVLVYTEDKYGNRETYRSDKQYADYPMVVLVNGSSASASEIFAGAVKDYGRGTLVGTTTFGKGIVQTIFPLENGDAVKLTTAKYYTPKGNNIHGVGIEPDEVVEYEYTGDKEAAYDKQYDNQFLYALSLMRGMLE